MHDREWAREKKGGQGGKQPIFKPAQASGLRRTYTSQDPKEPTKASAAHFYFLSFLEFQRSLYLLGGGGGVSIFN